MCSKVYPTPTDHIQPLVCDPQAADVESISGVLLLFFRLSLSTLGKRTRTPSRFRNLPTPVQPPGLRLRDPPLQRVLPDVASDRLEEIEVPAQA